MKTLVVIEAVGKKEPLERIFSELGYDARVFATKGHFLSMPSSLTPVGIDASFNDFARGPQTPAAEWVCERLREYAGESDEVFIATDADTEGDVIAWDVASIITDIHANPARLKLRAIEREAVEAAIKSASDVKKMDAVSGRTRALLDRSIGATFSREGISVGRVGTALLSLIDKKKPARRKLQLAAPSADGRGSFIAETPIKEPISREIAERLAAFEFPPLDVQDIAPAPGRSPGNMGDAMISAGDKLGMSPKEAAASMQRSYEAGRLSYPRADSKGISKAGQRGIERAMRRAAQKFSASYMPEPQKDDVHDAPHPKGDFDPSLDPRKLDRDDAITTQIGRDLVRCGQKHNHEKPNTTKLRKVLSEEFPSKIVDFVCALDWRREVGPRYPGQQRWAESGIIDRRPDTIVLEEMVKVGLGRPSTWAGHAETLVERGLVDEEMQLTEKGRRWLNASPESLKDLRTSIAIERACDELAERAYEASKQNPEKEPWQLLATRITKALPADIATPLKTQLSQEKAPEELHQPQPAPELPDIEVEEPGMAYEPEEKL